MATVTVTHPRLVVAPFRICRVTGYQVFTRVQGLIVFQAVAAVLSLATGGVLALLMALTRWEAVGLLPPELYYRFTSAHGTVMLVFWIVFFEVAALLFGGTVLINHRLKGVAVAWAYSWMMAIGAVLTTVMALSGQANNMFTAYPPLVNHPLWYVGILLFAVGALLACGHFVVQLWTARKEGVVAGPFPLVVYALLTAAIIAIWTLLHGALAYVPALLQSLGWITLDPAIYRTLFWGFGHGAQQINLAAMVACWYALAALTTGARPVNEGISRFAFVLYLIGINMGSMHHLLVDPGIGMHARIINTSYFMYAALLGSLIHAFSIPAAVETAQRARGHGKGLFGWLLAGPWREPGFSSLMISLIGFGFIAGVSGVLMGTMQLNMLIHNTLFVVGHFHATVVLGTTMAFMGLSYYVVPLVMKRDLALLGMARITPYVFGTGLLTLIAGMMLAGKNGVARRAWDATYSLGALPTESLSTPMISFSNALIGIGALISVVGGIMYVLIMVTTVFLGRPNETPNVGRLGVVASSAGPVSDVPIPEFDHTATRAQAPGTTVAVYVFLGYFVLMFAWAFFNLGRVGWGIG
jgi:cytochrome c oxidase subunit I